EKPQSFRSQSLSAQRQSGRVTTDESGTYWVASYHDNGNRLGCRSGSLRSRRAGRHDDVHWQADKLGRQHWQATGPSLRIPLLDHNVLTFDVAEFLQALAEVRQQQLGRATGQNPDPPRRAGRERSGEQMQAGGLTSFVIVWRRRCLRAPVARSANCYA